jgi:hypothetical protein
MNAELNIGAKHFGHLCSGCILFPSLSKLLHNLRCHANLKNNKNAMPFQDVKTFVFLIKNL